MPVDLSIVGKKLGSFTRHYTWKDVVLYALGVGATYDELDYCYEKRLKVIPSFAVTAIDYGVNLVGSDSDGQSDVILHGEHDLFLHKPIAPEGGMFRTESRVSHVFDKGRGRGALIVMEMSSYDQSGAKLFTNIMTGFAPKGGGFGGPNAPTESFNFPDRPPDYEEAAVPSTNQPLLYRLSGDAMPLHVDPEFAKAAGFEGSIMHGLCTYGYACRAIVKHLLPGEPERLGRLRVRFSRPLYPGDPIKTLIWKTGEGTACFRVVNCKTGEVVLDRGIADWGRGES
ncbi:MAG: 3-alpha,7-alpha,12-alpha-trihydroxy-5-beta-cholest-24-enoyl-CoA hydratase [Chloroflexota bacterium]|nr:MAG: 3-alpha,7-alpha,12-alpha-trihydroxy-5-beta-cholest-24-enoyl-CoA hydratase [Chloroflexota bacterium]